MPNRIAQTHHRLFPLAQASGATDLMRDRLTVCLRYAGRTVGGGTSIGFAFRPPLLFCTRPMSTRQRKQSKLKPLLVPVCCLFVLGYFAYHAVEGDYGLFALGKLQDRVAALEVQLDAVRAERAHMERHVALVRPESLDKDMIDERAREALNMADAKDIVIFLDPGDRRSTP
jgi:cell division protein FtsB